MSEEEIEVNLAIVSECLTADEISEIVGIPPDKARNLGEMLPGRSLPQKRTQWILNSGGCETEEVEDQLRKLLSKCRPHAERIRKISHEHRVVVNCVVWAEIDLHRASFNIEPALLTGISQLGATLVLSFYAR